MQVDAFTLFIAFWVEIKSAVQPQHFNTMFLPEKFHTGQTLNFTLHTNENLLPEGP